MAWRYFATRLNGDGTETETVSDIPASGVQITDSLSAPDQMNMTVRPEMLALKTRDGRPVFLPWATAVYAESDGVIRHGSIVTRLSTGDSGSSLTVESTGFSAYPKGMPWTNTTKKLYQWDPADVIRLIWDYLQSHPLGNLGVRLNGTKSTAKVGVKTPEVKDSKGEVTTQAVDEPILLANYATTDLGALIDELAEAGALDWREHHAWTSAGTIEHRIDLSFPRAGTRRHDLLLDTDVNCLAIPDVDIHADDYASEVLLLCAGEGDKMVRAHAYVPAPSRLRRVAVEQGKHIGRADTARTVAANRARLKNTFATDVAEVRVYDHPLAPLHSWQPGDELRLVGDAGWAGELDQWVRVMSTTYEPDAFEAGATLTVTRADRT